jgi:5'-nucleotidase
VILGGGTLPDGTACAADTIPSGVTITGATAPVTVTGLNQNGTLTLENDSDGVTLDGSQVNGRTYVENNLSEGTAMLVVSGNTVTGSLYCTGNNPPPVDDGSINTVSGTASGQCAAIAQR